MILCRRNIVFKFIFSYLFVTDLKTTDLKMLVLYRELCLLRDLEKSDRDLAEQFERQRQNKVDIIAKVSFINFHESSNVFFFGSLGFLYISNSSCFLFVFLTSVKMASCDERLLEKKQQLEEILQNERGILSSMNEVVSQFEERADLKDVLWKIFRKKVNRRSDSDGNDDDSMDFDDDGDFGDVCQLFVPLLLFFSLSRFHVYNPL